MDKYKRTESFPSTSYADNYFDLPTNNNNNNNNNNYNQYHNQFSNTNTFNQNRHNAFLSPSSPNADLVMPSILASGSSNKFGTATARRTKKKQLRTSLSTSLANKSNLSEWGDNQSNQETAPFLNELTELDILDGPSSYEHKRKTFGLNRKSISKKDSKSTFGTTNDTSLNINTDNAFESLPMNMNSDDEWK